MANTFTLIASVAALPLSLEEAAQALADADRHDREARGLPADSAFSVEEAARLIAGHRRRRGATPRVVAA